MGLTVKEVLSINSNGTSSSSSSSSSSSTISTKPSLESSTQPSLDDDGNIWMEVDSFRGDEDVRKEVERAAMQRMRLRQFDSFYFTGAGKFQAIPDEMSPEEILAQARSAASRAKMNLDSAKKKIRVGFLRKKDKGEIAYAITEDKDRVRTETASAELSDRESDDERT